MIDKVTKELEGFKAKVQETIDHVKSGVNHLNEDQIAKAAAMVRGLGHEIDDVIDNCLDHLGVDTYKEPYIPASVEPVPPPPAPEPPADPQAEPAHPAADPSDGQPSAADLDAVADEEAAKDATAKPALWGGEAVQAQNAEQDQ